VAEAIQSALRGEGPPDAAPLAPYRSVLKAFIPEWAAEPAPAEISPILLFEGVVRLTNVLAGEAGCVMILEDLHWADADSLALVEYLADNIGDERVLCLATIRSDEPSAASATADRLAARRAVTRLDLPRLTEERVEEMARVSLSAEPAESLLRVLRERAEGVPFLIEEMLSAYVASGSERAELALPSSYRDLVRGRMESLDPPARAVVDAAALLGPTFEWTLLPSVTGLERDAVLAGLRAAASAQIIATSFGSGFRFRHALVPETILQELLPPERRELSRKTAVAIEEAFPGVPGEWCERAADLREDAGDSTAAAAHLMEAGARALKRGALATAEAALERARELVIDDNWHRMGVERLLTDVLTQAGKTARIREIGASLLAFVVAKSRLHVLDANAQAPFHLQIARALGAAGDWGSARDHLERVRVIAEKTGDRALSAAVLSLEAQALLADGNIEGARVAAEEALAGGERATSPDVVCDALLVLGEASFRRGDAAEAARILERARATAESAGLLTRQIRALLEIGAMEIWEGTTAHVEMARSLAVGAGAISSHAHAELLTGWTLFLRSDLEPAARSFERCLDLSRRFQLPLLARASIGLAFVHAQNGNRDAMEDALTASDSPDARAYLALREEDRTEAREQLVRATSAHAEASALPFASGFAAFIRALDGDADEEEGASQPALPLDVAGSRLARAVALGRAGRLEEAAALAGEVDAALAGFPAFRHLARRLVFEAAVRDGWGDPVPRLRESVAFFESTGADALAAACKKLMKKAGGAVPRKGRGDSLVPAELRARGITSREMDVLRLVGEGLSNRQIAERLFVSPRTVETHVASSMRKLELETRAHLVALAARTPGP
jgi:DNA-binding CsgD family transcriptional regulator/tetratricopeptide (TPR) repeat protein